MRYISYDNSGRSELYCNVSGKAKQPDKAITQLETTTRENGQVRK